MTTKVSISEDQLNELQENGEIDVRTLMGALHLTVAGYDGE